MSIKVKSANDDRSVSRVANIGRPVTAIGGSSTNSTNCTNSSSVRPAKGAQKKGAQK